MTSPSSTLAPPSKMIRRIKAFLPSGPFNVYGSKSDGWRDTVNHIILAWDNAACCGASSVACAKCVTGRRERVRRLSEYYRSWPKFSFTFILFSLSFSCLSNWSLIAVSSQTWTTRKPQRPYYPPNAQVVSQWRCFVCYQRITTISGS